MTENKKLSPTKALAAKLIYAALTILHDSDKEMPMRELVEKIENTVELNEWEKERYEKSGYIRWRSVLHFYSIDLVKAGFLIKKEGIWYITPEGEEALKLGDVGLLESAQYLTSARFGQMSAFLKLRIICNNLKLGGMHDNQKKVQDFT